MNKVITINLGGNAYQLEEGGYDALRAYLETATARLQGNPDRDEILSDIENAIAEKFRALLATRKTVVETKEVTAVLADMGPIEADDGEPATPGATGANAASGAGGSKAPGPGPAPAYDWKTRRLYRINEGAMLAGVCNGIGAYMNIDPTFVRIAFVLLTSFWGTGLLLYVVLAFVVPEAQSPEEKAAASGFPATAQEFIRRAKEGYYEGMKNFPDRKARREWQRRFKREMRANADRWRCHWYGYWAPHFPVHPGMGFAVPFISMVQGAAMVLWLCASISLLATGAIFGLALPASLPAWAALLLLLIAYGLLTGPLKLAKRACYWGLGEPKHTWSFVVLLDIAVWLVVVTVLLTLAVHFSPQLRDAVHGFPSLAHQAVDDIRNWWQKK